MNNATDEPTNEEMLLHYKETVERAIRHIPVKNGVVDIDSIWVETSIPFELLREILGREDLTLPENVERISVKSRACEGDRSGKPRKARKRRRHKVRN